MKAIMRYISKLLIGVTIVCGGFFSLLPAESFPPTFVLGTYGTGIVFTEGSSAVDTVGGVEINGLMGWRKPLSSGGYVAINSSIGITGYFIGTQDIEDEETGTVEVSIPAGIDRVKIDTGITSSILGTGGYSRYYRPDWEVEYRFQRGRRKIQPYGAYQGHLLIQPDDNEDAFFQGGKIGFSYRPSIRHGYELSAGGGWENWFEYPLYDAGGSTTGETRHDYIMNLEGKTDGLIGYFADWDFATTVTLRFSNANRYLESLAVLDENSESRLGITMEGGVGWSPTRRINLQIGPYAARDHYFEREALNEDGSLSGDKLRIFTIGSMFRDDWTADDRWYIVAKGSGARKYANDVAETGWNIALKGGMEYGF